MSHTTTRHTNRRRFLTAGGALALTGLAGACGLGSDPFDSSGGGASDSSAGGTVVVGSQQYYSNEIIAELYAQVLEKAGLTVTRQYQIGQREVYLPEMEAGNIDVLPEYGGNLLQYYDKDSRAADADGVQKALPGVLPQGLVVLTPAEATDQDSYTVTRASAQENSLTTIADLASLGRTVKVAANSEFATRPYGPDGVKATYGVDAAVEPVEDSGGPLTVKALTDGSVDVADVPTSSPAITTEDLVVLEDPESLILPQNVTPLVRASLPASAVQAIGTVQAQLSADDLRALNARSTGEQLDSATIAKDWLTQKGLL